MVDAARLAPAAGSSFAAPVSVEPVDRPTGALPTRAVIEATAGASTAGWPPRPATWACAETSLRRWLEKHKVDPRAFSETDE